MGIFLRFFDSMVEDYMESILDSLYEDYGVAICKRYEVGTLEEKEKIVKCLEQLAKHIEPGSLYRRQSDVLSDLKEAMDNSDRARVFFSYSFVSWYRCYSKGSLESRLDIYSELDISNRSLYAEMLGLRDTGTFNDEGLYEFEQYCLSVIGKGRD